MQSHPELLTRAFEIRKYYYNLMLEVPLYNNPMATPKMQLNNPFPGYSPFKKMDSGNNYINNFSAINLSPPMIFVPPHFLQPPTEQRYSRWALGVYYANKNKVVPIRGETESGKQGSQEGRGAVAA